MSNFCCNDDFNANGIFDSFDVHLYDVFVTTCLGGTCPQTVQELLDAYNYAASQQTKPPLEGGLDHLPEFDCSDFNLNGIFDSFDVHLYDVFVTTCLGGTCPQTVQELLDAYNYAASQQTKPPLVGGLDHLPRLEGECGLCIRVTSGPDWMQGTYKQFEVNGPGPLVSKYYATYDMNSPTKDLLENNLHRVAMNSLEADGMPGHYTITFQDYSDKHIAHSAFYESSSADSAVSDLVQATEFRYKIYTQDDEDPPNEVVTEYISTIQVASVECAIECGCEYASNEYLIQSGNTSSAVDNLSAEWQRDFGGKLCYGDIEHGTPRTYVAYIGSDTNPVGTITITGEAYLPSQLTYYDALGNCYTAIPTIENGVDVYRFQSVIASTTLPVPTPTPITPCATITSANNKGYGSDVPVKHEAGATYYWCMGTQYTDPGVQNVIDCLGNELTVENGGIEIQFWNQSKTTQITDPVEIQKLGQETSSFGPSNYTFSVRYKAISQNGQESISGGRIINVVQRGTVADPSKEPCPSCCNSTANEHQVDTNQQPQFVATGITLMSFAYNGSLCLGNSTGGLPRSISLYVPGYSDAIGVISVLGDLDSNEISLEVTADIYLSNGVPSLIGKCMKGTIINDRCDLTEN